MAVGDANVVGHGDGTSKPEEGGQGVDGEARGGANEAMQDEGCEGQVQEDSNGPHAVEEHEVEGRDMAVGDVYSWCAQNMSVACLLRTYGSFGGGDNIL